MAGTPLSIVLEEFARKYPGTPSPEVYCAPGRVNLIGEHTDYNLGFVLPIAIDLACYTATAPSADGKLRIYSKNEEDGREWPIAEIPNLKPSKDWTDYPIGVAQKLHAAGFSIPAQNLAIYSTVPVGSGLSSSAAIEVSSALAFLGGRRFPGRDLAQLCQRAEIEFVGMPCGIMDQYVSVFGEAHKAIRIDCRSITHESITLPAGVAVIAVNSMVKHELGTSAYRDRVRECGQAVEIIRARYPNKQSLRDVTSPELEAVRPSMPDLIYRRALHVVTEDERVERFGSACAAGDLKAMGTLFVESHRSLQYYYQVSSIELDFLVDSAIRMDNVFGARMTGGGFGGCTVNLVKPESTQRFREEIADLYFAKFKIKPLIYTCVPGPGAHRV